MMALVHENEDNPNWAERMQQTERTVELAEAFLTQGQTPTIDLGEAEQKIHSHWLDAMQQHHEAKFDDCSLAEALFLSLCAVRCCSDPGLREQLPLTGLYEVLLPVVLPACSHKPQFMQPYSLDGFANCDEHWRRAMAFLVQHFVQGATAVELDLLQHKFSEDSLSAELFGQWERLQICVNNEDDMKRRQDLINRGYVFRCTATELARHFLPLLNRCAVQLETERMLSNRFTHQPKLHFHPSCRQRIQQWLIRVSQVEADEKFGLDFREFVLEHCLPHGSRTRCLRKAATASNKDTAQTLLVQELGVDLAQEILTSLNELQYAALSSDSSHPVHGSYLLSRFSHDFFHRLRLHWLDLYYITPTRLLTEKHRFDDKSRNQLFRIRPTPLMTRLGGRFYVRDCLQLHPCEDAYELILTWLWQLQLNHNTKTRDQVDCSRYIDLFKPQLG